jgi:hypothetical protein
VIQMLLKMSPRREAQIPSTNPSRPKCGRIKRPHNTNVGALAPSAFGWGAGRPKAEGRKQTNVRAKRAPKIEPKASCIDRLHRSRDANSLVDRLRHLVPVMSLSADSNNGQAATIGWESSEPVARLA